MLASERRRALFIAYSWMVREILPLKAWCFMRAPEFDDIENLRKALEDQ